MVADPGGTVGLLMQLASLCCCYYLLVRILAFVKHHCFPDKQRDGERGASSSFVPPLANSFGGSTSLLDQNPSGMRQRTRTATPVRRSPAQQKSVPEVVQGDQGGGFANNSEWQPQQPQQRAHWPGAAPLPPLPRNLPLRTTGKAAFTPARYRWQTGLSKLHAPLNHVRTRDLSAHSATLGGTAAAGAPAPAAEVDESGWHLLIETIEASKTAFAELRSRLGQAAALPEDHADVLSNLLSQNRLCRVEVPGDGDCLFHAVLFGVSQCPQRRESFSHCTAFVSNNIGQAVALGSRDARTHAVRWLSQHMDLPVVAGLTPRCVIASSNGGMVAEEYLSNMSGGEWGDELMVVALASIFQVNLIIFPNRKEGEIVCIAPVVLDRHLKVVTGLDFPDVCVGHLYNAHYVACKNCTEQSLIG